jgi:hypothetical protein
MKQIQIRILGTEIFSLILFSGDPEPEYEEAEGDISGGSAQNFERDVNPIAPEDRYGDEEFGFRA